MINTVNEFRNGFSCGSNCCYINQPFSMLTGALHWNAVQLALIETTLHAMRYVSI